MILFYVIRNCLLSFLVAFLIVFPAKAEPDKIYQNVIQTQTIHCGYAEWPPFLVVDPTTLEVSGLMRDVWDMIGQKLHLKVEWSQSLGWGEVTEAVKAGKVDVFCVGVWPDAGRVKNLLLSRAVFYNPTYLYARGDDHRFDNNYAILNDPSYVVSGQEGDISASIFELNFPKARTAHITPMQPQGEMVLNVVTKKGDVTLLDVPYADDYLANNPGKIRRVEGPPVAILPIVIPLSVGEYQLKNMIDVALNDMINDGTISGLIKKWNAKETYAPMPDVVIPSGQ